ncbi:MAG TPA: carbon-nitrogen hydrolase family protein [Anaerolineae bacterium]|nr:carbon-nitrogen hydrolase family protein [Anaerolineae bacterium]HQI83104.1 carbon-nitrogen hydrolase family protein [Anaerolineae bacterium]
MNVKVAVAQMDPKLGQNESNLARILALLREAAAAGARLVVFPECAVSGYGFATLEAGYAAAETIPGPATDALAAACRETGAYAVVGLLERDGIENVYNSAALVGPEGVVGVYRKAHLPLLGVDRFTTPGDSGFRVCETAIGRVGIIICYDLRFPEAARVLALVGADIIALPTNWPDGSQNAPYLVTRTRALENRVFLLACNRCGEESGFWFFGHSQITDPGGNVLVEADAGEEICYAEIEPAQARQKRIVLRPDAFELDTVGDRRPDLYGALAKF